MGFIQSMRTMVAQRLKRPPKIDKAALEAERAKVREALERKAHMALLEGVKACTTNRYVDAMDSFQAAFIAFLRAENKEDASLTQKVIGLLLIHIKDDNQVRQACMNARAALEQEGLRDEAARILMFLGDFETDRDEFRNAANAYKSAVHLCRTVQYVDGEVDSLCRYGLSEAKRGKPADARNLMGQAKAAAERHNRDDLVEHIEQQSEQVIALAAPALMSGKGSSGNRRF